MLKRFSVRDLILIAAFAAIGIAIKPIVGPMVKMISTPLGIPGGSFAGGFYMLWLVLAVVIVDKATTGTVFGILQGLGVLIFGIAGNQGAVSLITYTVPGLVADLIYGLIRQRKGLAAHLLLCSLANVSGALMSAALIFRHPPLIMIGIASLSIGSGIVGGYLSFAIHSSLKKMRII
jgi:energy-coupling factor transport system substrate-specific component